MWTSSLFSVLRAVAPDEVRFKKSYNITASELRICATQGCKWCKSLADGIHSCVHLNSIYDQFNHSASSESNASTEEDPDQDGGEKGFSDVSDSDHERAKEGSEDPTPGGDVDPDLDTLAFECQFSVELSFQRGDASSFTLLNVRIESFDQEEDNTIRKLRGEKAVELQYHAHMTGER